MARQRYTLAQLKDRLTERAGNNATFWTEPEKRDALNEAICVWQALTGEWTTRVNISARSDFPSFYPVPKQIVSLTRVGIDSAAATADPLDGWISINHPIYESDVDLSTYHGAYGLTCRFRFMPTGGVGPYSVEWDFGDGTSTVYSGTETVEHTFPEPADPYSPASYVITATVTDTAGDTTDVVQTYTMLDPYPRVWVDGAEAVPGVPVEVAIVDGGADYVYFTVPIYMKVDYNGDTSTNYAGNIYGGRYPFRIEFDFAPGVGIDVPVVGTPVSELSQTCPVERVELYDSGMVLQETYTYDGGDGLRIPHEMLDFSQWNNGDPTLLRGYSDGLDMRQDPDDVQDTVPGYVRVYIRRFFWLTHGVNLRGNFQVFVTDGTGKTVRRLVEYMPAPAMTLSLSYAVNPCWPCGATITATVDVPAGTPPYTLVIIWAGTPVTYFPVWALPYSRTRTYDMTGYPPGDPWLVKNITAQLTDGFGGFWTASGSITLPGC